MSEDDIDFDMKYRYLNLIKSIPASITIFLCFILIITYFISFLQVKFNIFIKEDIKEEITNEPRYSQNSFNETAGLPTKEEENTSKKKIGLGSHYMFFLILSNFFGGIAELIFLLTFNFDFRQKKYSDNLENNKYECKIFGFLHNFFDLSSVCWTTMLTYLFYKSTNLSSEILYKDGKYLFIGFVFWFFSWAILCGIPYYRDKYGFSETYCAFKKTEDAKDDFDKIELLFWTFFFIIYVLLNSIFNCIWLYKTTKFYSKKLKNLKNQNIKEYNVLFIFVKVFQIFPIVLIITRIIKLGSVVFIVFIIINKNNDTIKQIIKVFSYISGFCYNINGAFNSLACIYFFRGVFWCCFKEKDKDKDDKIDNNNDNNIYNQLYESSEKKEN